MREAGVRRDVLSPPGVPGSVEIVTQQTSAPELWTYRDIERRTGRPYGTLRSDQAAAAGRREAGTSRASDMPAPEGKAKTRPQHHRRYRDPRPGQDGELVFDSAKIRAWCLLHDWEVKDP